MTAADRVRRWIGWAAVVGTALSGGLVQPVAGADAMPDPRAAPNRLETPISDLAVLEPRSDETGATPLLVTLAADPPERRVATVSILGRGREWEAIDEVQFALDDPDLAARWLIGLAGDRFALIATSARSMPGTGSATVIGFEVRRDGDSARIVELGKHRIDRAVEAAGAPDVDGLGTAELALALRPSFEEQGSCGRTSLLILDSATFAVRRAFDPRGTLGTGVIGRFDEAPGDDLLVYASVDCPPGELGGARLMSIRLSDGTRTTVVDQGRDLLWFPPPVLLRLPGEPWDRAIAAVGDDVAIIDGRGHDPHYLASSQGAPLVAGPDPSDPGSALAAWIDADGIHAARFAATREATVAEAHRTELVEGVVDPARWSLMLASVGADVASHGVANAWLGPVTDDECADLLLPGAMLPCGETELRSGAAWIGTRPLASVPVDGRRTLLVAAGIDWSPEDGVPRSPSPWSGGPVGWWRQGPSVRFAVSETRADDVAYFEEFPTPRSTIETTTGRDGTTVLPGFTGTRLFVTVTPLGDEGTGPDVAGSALDGLLSPPGPGGIATVVRVPVEPGNESGRDGSFTTLTIGDVDLGGGAATTRWAVRATAINDWGEVGVPAVGTVVRDATGPTLNLETPFTTPPWPFEATLAGRAEPGSTVTVAGIGEVEVDRRGRFSFDTPLAPWPQTVLVTATDANGNESVGEFSVVGGVDYRRFPWPVIIAVAMFAVVTWRGLMSAGRRSRGVESTPWSTGAFDEAAMPEIEEIPPGKGLARS